MSTNIEVDDALIKEALEVTGLPDGRAVVEKALRLLVRLQAQEAAADLFGKVPVGDDYKAMRERDVDDRR